MMAPSPSSVHSKCKLAVLLAVIFALVPLVRCTKEEANKKSHSVRDGSIANLRNVIGTSDETESLLEIADSNFDKLHVSDENVARRLSKKKRNGRRRKKGQPKMMKPKMMKPKMMKPKTMKPKTIRPKRIRPMTPKPTPQPTPQPKPQCPAKQPANVCSTDPLSFHESIGMRVELVGRVPVTTTAPFSYNMMVVDNFDDDIYFLNQLGGLIYSYDDTSKTVTKVFDIAESDIPAGLTLDFVTDVAGAGQISRVHAMSKGSKSNEIYVVFSSTTLPAAYTEAQARLPPTGAFPGYMCKEPPFFVRDLYRVGDSGGCGFKSRVIYNVFYKYTVQPDGSLVEPVPFFALEQQLAPGHLGGGMVTLDDGRVLWGVGDCIIYGSDGRYGPQLDWVHCGKILMINPNDSTYEVVAKGVRNSQQFRISKFDGNEDVFVFMDIGGVTAEEVNAVPLREITDIAKIDNFGWGRNMKDGKAREGSFYVGPGIIGVLGTEPPCESNAPANEEGYILPWIQFGRSADDMFYGISSFSVAMQSFTSLKLIWTEFNTGLIMGTDQNWSCPADGFKIKAYDVNGNYLEGGLNDMVKAELGEQDFGYRGDPRMFHYPDGTAGVFIERTGAFYKLTEISI